MSSKSSASDGSASPRAVSKQRVSKGSKHSSPHASKADSKIKSPQGSKMSQKAGGQCKPICGHLCAKMPVNIPQPKKAVKILHPANDVFVLKVAKVGANGDRRCKMEVELVTPKSTLYSPKVPYRLDTREAQCDPCPSCICQSGPMKPRKRPVKKEH